MTVAAKTAEEAYALVAGTSSIPGSPSNIPLATVTPFICPYCGVNSQHKLGTLTFLTVFVGTNGQAGRGYNGSPLVAAECQNCSKETLFSSGKVIIPEYSAAPMPATDMPVEVVDDFEEARSIVAKSPRGAAALLRLVIQKLCPILGATKSDINAAIGELVAAGKVSPALQQALDTVRVVGNEAVHPGTLDLSDDRQTATSMFGLINFIVEKAITEPKQIGLLYQALPAGKLAGIAQRDKV